MKTEKTSRAKRSNYWKAQVAKRTVTWSLTLIFTIMYACLIGVRDFFRVENFIPSIITSYVAGFVLCSGIFFFRMEYLAKRRGIRLPGSHKVNDKLGFMKYTSSAYVDSGENHHHHNHSADNEDDELEYGLLYCEDDYEDDYEDDCDYCDYNGDCADDCDGDCDYCDCSSL
ncbi:MAG: hypothetical protein K2I56_07280 [Muribaculaceae bacterium]|nr:hypothetical protein [Muribaculaceae bacterium]